MSDHLIAVIACWMVALCGLAMFVRAKSLIGQMAGHAAVFVALLSLSAMALDHDHSEFLESPARFVAGNQSDWYHVTTCPAVAKQKQPLVPLKDEREARESGRSPHDCVVHLASHVQQPPEHAHDHSHSPDSGE